MEEVADDAGGEGWGKKGEAGERIRMRIRVGLEEVGDLQVVPGFDGRSYGALKRGFVGGGGGGGEAVALQMAKQA